ncbi:hypothetical protein [Nocardiopsis metallicus]|uniref:Uncharacterized protein n=1 Tax=Nocardiopsis metallicus TaxID=179819 RepID=A0A840WZY6_9ACTN|nr:hypothetical protein [Nocardiopsis metallicus]MBB5495778.1 hypothetical protein [Nocardiopsis metallicus]
MSSNQMLAEVIQATGATKADVLRVATQGGATARDWEIARAIEAAGGRLASDLMFQPEQSWRAEHERLCNALWHQTRDEDVEFLREHAAQAGIDDITPLLPGVIEEQPEPGTTNPLAKHYADVTIYPEHTSPDESREIIAHHPSDHDEAGEDQEQDELAAAEALAATVHADLAEVLDDAEAATRLTRAWSTPAEGRQVLARVLEIDPRRWVREELAVRSIYDIAA